MGITTGLAGHQAGKGLVALVKQGLVVGGLLVVDQLVGLLQLSAMSCMVRIGGYSCRRRRMRRVTMPPISARPAMPAAVIISTYGVVWLDSSPVGATGAR